MLNPSYAFVGSGKMAEAMINGLVYRGSTPASRIIATGPRSARGSELRDRFGVTVDTNNLACAQADIVVLSVKPQYLNKVCAELKGKLRRGVLVVSIVAGIPIECIVSALAVKQLVRAMPNTPGQIGRGITVWTATRSVTRIQHTHVDTLLRSLGDAVHVEHEDYLDMATAVSGSGPAYVFLFMEAWIDAAVKLGFSRQVAGQLVQATLIGSAEYAKSSKRHPAELRNDVTSPAGTTAEALSKLEAAGFRTALTDAIEAAFNRAQNLGRKA